MQSSIEQKSTTKQFLYQDIQHCIDILQANQSEIKQRSTLYWYTLATLLVKASVCIASPVLFWKLILGYSEFIAQELSQREMQQMEIKEERNRLEAKFESMRDKAIEDDSLKTIRLAKAWKSCTMFSIPCTLDGSTQYEMYPVPDYYYSFDKCNDLGKRFCGIRKNTYENLKQLDYNYHAQLEAVKSVDSLSSYSSFFVCTAILLTITAFFAVIYYLMKYDTEYYDFEKDINNLKLATKRIQESGQENFMNLTSRLGINVEGLTTDDLINQLSAKKQEIDLRWKYKIAFLGAALRKDTALCHFLTQDGARDLTKKIFQEAGLYPSLS